MVVNFTTHFVSFKVIFHPMLSWGVVGPTSKNSKICQSKGCYRTAYDQRNWNFILAHGWLSKGIFGSLNFTYTMRIQKVSQKTEPFLRFLLCRYTWSKSEDKHLNFGQSPHLNHSWVFMKQIPINHITIHVGQTWGLLSKWDPKLTCNNQEDHISYNLNCLKWLKWIKIPCGSAEGAVRNPYGLQR